MSGVYRFTMYLIRTLLNARLVIFLAIASSGCHCLLAEQSMSEMPDKTNCDVIYALDSLQLEGHGLGRMILVVNGHPLVFYIGKDDHNRPFPYKHSLPLNHLIVDGKNDLVVLEKPPFSSGCLRVANGSNVVAELTLPLTLEHEHKVEFEISEKGVNLFSNDLPAIANCAKSRLTAIEYLKNNINQMIDRKPSEFKKHFLSANRQAGEECYGLPRAHLKTLNAS